MPRTGASGHFRTHAPQQTKAETRPGKERRRLAQCAVVDRTPGFDAPEARSVRATMIAVQLREVRCQLVADRDRAGRLVPERIGVAVARFHCQADPTAPGVSIRKMVC